MQTCYQFLQSSTKLCFLYPCCGPAELEDVKHASARFEQWYNRVYGSSRAFGGKDVAGHDYHIADKWIQALASSSAGLAHEKVDGLHEIGGLTMRVQEITFNIVAVNARADHPSVEFHAGGVV